MRHRFVIAVFLLACLVAATVSAAPKTAPDKPKTKPAKPIPKPVPKRITKPKRYVPFWACSDGKGKVSLFWLPVEGQWPPEGFQLERIIGGKRVVLARHLRPGQDTESLNTLEPADAAQIRDLADKIEKGTLSDDDRNISIAVMGRAAATNLDYGRALGVRYTDRSRVAGKRVYRLTSLGPEGKPAEVMTSNEVDPARKTSDPDRPVTLKAEVYKTGVALYWEDPPASVLMPVVAYHVERIRSSGRLKEPLTPDRPLILKRHLHPGEPEFLDPEPPQEALVYRVQSVDIFGRRSAPVDIKISETEIASPVVPSERVARRPGGSLSALSDSSTETIADVHAEPPQDAEIAAPTTPPASAPAPPAVVAKKDIKPPPPPPPPAAKPAAVPSAPSPPAPVAKKDVKPPPPPPPPAAKPAAAPSAPAPPAPVAKKDVKPPPPPAAPPPAKEAPRMPREFAQMTKGSGPPPTPLLVNLQGNAGKVTITMKPGDPEDQTREILVLRNQSQGGRSVIVGRPLPGDTRQWEDMEVSPGQNFWYRLVAVDKAGNLSAPTRPRWVRVSAP